jgi:hypothetical protein
LAAENVLLAIYPAITEGLENVVVHPALDEMIALFTVSAGGDAFAAKACLQTCGPADLRTCWPSASASSGRELGEWLATVNAAASETETSCELVAPGLLRRGGRPVPCG